MSSGRIANLLELIENKQTDLICTALTDAKSAQSLHYNEETIKTLLCRAMEVYKDDEASLLKIIVHCSNYSNAYFGYLDFKKIDLFKDNTIINAACTNNCHAALRLLLDKFHSNITPSDTLNRYLLMLASEKNTASLCGLLNTAKENQKLLFDASTIKLMLRAALETYKDDEASLNKIIVHCYDYSSAYYGLQAFKINDLFNDNTVITAACANKLHAAVRILLEKYNAYIIPSEALNNYLLMLAKEKNTAILCNLLTFAKEKQKLLFDASVIKLLLCTAMETYKDDDASLIKIIENCCDYSNAYFGYQNFKIKDLFNDNTVINAACTNNYHAAIRLLLKKYKSYISPSEALNKYIVKLVAQKNTVRLCDLLTFVTEEQKLLFDETVIKLLLCAAMESYKEDKASLNKIIELCYRYSEGNYGYLRFKQFDLFNDNTIITAACANSCHAAVHLLLKKFYHYNIFSEALNNYLLTLAKSETNANIICELLEVSNIKNPLFSPDVIKNLLIKIIDWKDEIKREEVLLAIKNYAEKNNFQTAEIFFNDKLFENICGKDLLPIIKYFLTNYSHALTESAALSDYLLGKIESNDYSCAIELLSSCQQIDGASRAVFSPEVLGKTLHAAINQTNDKLFIATCDFINKFKCDLTKIFSVLNDRKENPLIAACRLERRIERKEVDYAIGLVLTISDIRALNISSTFNDVFCYDLALRNAYGRYHNSLGKSLLNRGAPTTLLDAEINDQTKEPFNPELAAFIKAAKRERAIFAILSDLTNIKNTEQALSQVRDAFENGASIKCKHLLNGYTPLIFMCELDTQSYTSAQADFYANLVDLFIECGADVSQLTNNLKNSNLHFNMPNSIHSALYTNKTLFLSALKAAVNRHKVDSKGILDAASTYFSYGYPRSPEVEKIIKTFNDVSQPLKAVSTPAPLPSEPSTSVAPLIARRVPLTSVAPSIATSSAPVISPNISDMIRKAFTDKAYVFNWDDIVKGRISAADLNTTVSVGTKKILFFDAPDNANLLDVFMHLLNVKKLVPSADEMEVLFQRGLKPILCHSKSGFLLSTLQSHPNYIPIFLKHGASWKLLDAHPRKINILADWLILHAQSTDLTDNAIAYLKPFKLELWNAVKTMFLDGEINLEKLKTIKAELDPGFVGSSAIRSVMWAGHTDPTKKRLHTILTELDELIKSASMSLARK